MTISIYGTSALRTGIIAEQDSVFEDVQGFQGVFGMKKKLFASLTVFITIIMSGGGSGQPVVPENAPRMWNMPVSPIPTAAM